VDQVQTAWHMFDRRCEAYQRTPRGCPKCIEQNKWVFYNQCKKPGMPDYDKPKLQCPRGMGHPSDCK